jgi:hypothetical protein
VSEKPKPQRISISPAEEKDTAQPMRPVLVHLGSATLTARGDIETSGTVISPEAGTATADAPPPTVITTPGEVPLTELHGTSAR